MIGQESFFENRLVRLHWLVPLLLTAAAMLYPLGPARWIHTYYHGVWHQIAEVVFYAFTGPIVGLWVFMRAGRWLDAKDAGQ